MKAQDKIYIPIVREEKRELLCTIWWPEDNRTESDKEFISGVIPYIRKDALLEWAKEHYTSLDITKRDMWDGGYNCAIKELIDKLNSL